MPLKICYRGSPRPGIWLVFNFFFAIVFNFSESFAHARAFQCRIFSCASFSSGQKNKILKFIELYNYTSKKSLNYVNENGYEPNFEPNDLYEFEPNFETKKEETREALILLAFRVSSLSGISRARTYDLHDVNVAL